MSIGEKVSKGLNFYEAIKKPARINLKALVHYESGGNPNAVSGKGAVGLTQIKVSGGALDDWNKYHKNERYTPADLKKPAVSLKIGDWYANKRIPAMLNAYKIPDSIMTRIASYNWGIGGVRKWHKKGGGFNRLPAETQRSIRRYMEYNK